MMSAMIRIEARRIDIGVAHHEFFENIVLDGSASSALSTPCSSPATMKLGQDRDHSAVHRHRNDTLIQRNAVKQDFHILDTVDRHAGLADIALDRGWSLS